MPQAEPLTWEKLERKFQAAWQLFQSIEGQVQVANRKVQAIFAANTLLVAAVSFQNQGMAPSARAHSLSLSAIVGAAARLLLLACVCASYLSAPEFAETFLAMPTADKAQQVLHQTHEVSRVVAEKYR